MMPRINDLRLGGFTPGPDCSTIPPTEFNFAWLHMVSFIKGMEDAASNILASRIRGLSRTTIDSNRNIPIVDEREHTYQVVNWLQDLPKCKVSMTGDGAEVILPVKSKGLDSESYSIPVTAPKFTDESSVKEFHTRMCLAIRGFQQRLQIISRFSCQIPPMDSRYSLVQPLGTEQEKTTEYNANPFGSPTDGDNFIEDSRFLSGDRLDTNSLKTLQFATAPEFPFVPSEFVKIFQELHLSAGKGQVCSLKFSTVMNMLLSNMQFCLLTLRSAELRGQT